MSHGLLSPVYTYTPVKADDTVTTITVSCRMYNIPFAGDGTTDEDNKVELGNESFTWTVPTAHQSVTEFNIVDETDGDNILMEDGNTLVADIPYVINWKYIANKSNENHRKLIRASADYKSMMSTLVALQ